MFRLRPALAAGRPVRHLLAPLAASVKFCDHGRLRGPASTSPSPPSALRAAAIAHLRRQQLQPQHSNWARFGTGGTAAQAAWTSTQAESLPSLRFAARRPARVLSGEGNAFGGGLAGFAPGGPADRPAAPRRRGCGRAALVAPPASLPLTRCSASLPYVWVAAGWLHQRTLKRGGKQPARTRAPQRHTSPRAAVPQRYRICTHHRDVLSVHLKGQEQRFCQQCGTFHPIAKFNGNRRSCCDRLRKHALRRRKSSEGGRPSSWQWEEELSGTAASLVVSCWCVARCFACLDPRG